MTMQPLAAYASDAAGHRRFPMTDTITVAPRPRFAKINDAAKYSARSRGRLYELAHTHPELFRKDGKSTLVDLHVLDQILDALPQAKISLAWRFKKKQQQPPQPKPKRRKRQQRAA
jgi:hypothetical protein